MLLAATDPANAYGAALAWPARDEAAGRASRSAGASVLIADGHLLGTTSPGGGHLTTYLPPDEPDRSLAITTIAQALVAAAVDGPPLVLTKIDDSSVASSELTTALRAVGFESTSRGLLYRDYPSRCRGFADRNSTQTVYTVPSLPCLKAIRSTELP